MGYDPACTSNGFAFPRDLIMDAMQVGQKELGVEHNLFGARKKGTPIAKHFPLTSSPTRVSFPRLGCSLFGLFLVLMGSGLNLVLTSLT